MSRVMKTVPLIVLCALIIAVPSVWAYWVQDGVALCTATGDQNTPTIVSDGAGGSIVTWYDHRGGINSDIYAQRVNASGAVQWTANGVALCTATSDQLYPTITSDGAGGAIVTWYDARSGNVDIYAQRVNASGAVQWTANGVALCTATGTQDYPKITPDGAGGAVVTWQDYRSGTSYDVYAQRVNASGAVQWTTNGVALCTATGSQDSPQITSDGAGGAVVTWNDSRSGSNYDIYAQRVNASGAVQWTANGVALCMAGWHQYSPTITSDGAGGGIVTWYDYRSGSNYDIYAQWVNASGSVQWTANGVALCMAAGHQYSPTITSDGAGGAIVTWYDSRSGSNDIYAQRVNASGAIQWTADGVALCTAPMSQRYPTITSYGAGGAIVTWQDYRSGNYDIYVQEIDGQGRVDFFAPGILSVQDVPHDQGGHVRITIERSKLDDALESSYPVSTYDVWQRIDDPALLVLVSHGSGDAAPGARMNDAPLKRSVDASIIAGWPVKELNGRYFVQSRELLGAGTFPPGTWELVGSFSAYQQDQYIYRAGTLADSTASGTPYSVYIVSARTTTPSVWFVSDPDSGYSVDNLPPEVPGALVAEQSYTPVGLQLAWDINQENDLSYYAVYRGSSEDFVPGLGNRLATPTAPAWFDGSWRWNSGYYYKVSAIDVHDNQSGFALVSPDGVTGTETPKAPEASYLSQNYPNPFNPTTRIAFGLSAPAHVSLKIYGAAGRLVRALVNEERRAGRYEDSWDGRDSNGRSVASGIYFYRLNAGAFESTKKMILVR